MSVKRIQVRYPKYNHSMEISPRQRLNALKGIKKSVRKIMRPIEKKEYEESLRVVYYKEVVRKRKWKRTRRKLESKGMYIK